MRQLEYGTLVMVLLATSMAFAVSSKLIGFSDIAGGFPMATCWNAMGMDPRGNVYIVMSPNKKINPEDCLVLKYNPNTGERKNLGTFIDAAKAADNYSNNESIPKGHSYVPYFDGKMYIGSQPFHDRSKWEGMDLNGFRGSHIYTVDVDTDELVDISANQPDGVFQSRQGIMGLEAMPELGLVVAMSHPYGDLLFYDPVQDRVVRKVDGPPEGDAGEPIGRCVLTAPNGKVFFALGWSDYNMYVYDYHADELSKTGSEFQQGFWNGMAKTCDGTRGWIMTSLGYLYEIDFHNDRADYKGRFGSIDESFCLSMSPDETKLYTVPSKAGDCDGDLVEYDIASGNFSNVKDLGGDGDGWITGFNLRDDKHIFFSKNSNDYDGYILQIDVSDRSGPRPSGCETSGGGATLPDPLVHLDFDDVSGTTVRDVSGNGHDATVYGGAQLVEGVAGNGLNLDGDDDYADLPYQFPRQGSIALWYYPHRLYNYNTVFDNAVHENDWEMWIQGENIDEPWYECPYCWKFRLGGNDQARDVGRVNQDIREIGGDKTWHHAVVTWDESGATTLYLDGVQRDQAVSDGFGDAGGHVFLGGNNPGNPRGNGIMDEFMVFGEVLSAGDVTELYGSYSATPTDPPPTPSDNPVTLSASDFSRDGSCYEWNSALGALEVPVGSTGQSCEASAAFPGSTGVYTIRLTVVAEDDGQSKYRVSVDGTQVGDTYTAPLESGERTVVIAESVSINEGATITVWSENGGSAWGRWTEVEFEKVSATLLSSGKDVLALRSGVVSLPTAGGIVRVAVPGGTFRTMEIVDARGRVVARADRGEAVTRPLAPGLYVASFTGRRGRAAAKLTVTR